MMSNNQPILMLIDGHALAYRAYFAMQRTAMSTSGGEPTFAVYGFINMLLAVWKEFQPDYFIVTFDRGDTFRHQMYPDYKATRDKMPDDLRSQISRIEQVVRAFNMPVFTKENYEADDLLGTLSHQAAAQGIEALIVTGDRDAFQLVTPHIKVLYPGGQNSFNERVVYDEAQVKERYGLAPKQLIELKGLTGDTSDNIPGVKGIGEKGGAKLIEQYGTLENIYENLSSLPKGMQSKLEADRDNAFLSRDLGRIIIDVPDVSLNLEAGKTADFDKVAIANLFMELEFNTIYQRIPGIAEDTRPADVATVKPAPAASGPIAPDGVYTTINTAAALAELVDKLARSPSLSVDVETDSTDEVQTRLVGIAITPAPHAGYYIPVGHGQPLAEAQASLFETTPTMGVDDLPPQLDLAVVQAALAPILADGAITKYMHNAKFDMTVLERHGMPIAPPIFDTMVAVWLANNAPDARYGLKELVREQLHIQMTEIKELIGAGKNQITMVQVPIAKATPYAAADVDMTMRLADWVRTPLTQNTQFQHIFDTLEMPLIYVLKDMELAGIKLDTAVLRQMSTVFTARLLELEQEIHQTAGLTFNINSTQQLSDVLFGKLGLPTHVTKKTKSGHYSTAAGVLESLAGMHPLIDLILEQRTLAKLKSTYVDALPALVNPHTGRVHTNYNQIGISTGRLSSNEPNLQNIPVRTIQGREIRRAFVAEPGCRLISADYSQVELRILAHIAQDPGLLTAFSHDEDIHAATAAAVLGLPLAEVTKDQRRIAKAVNFGLIYGQTAHGLAQGTGMTRTQAVEFINTYFDKYPGVRSYIDQTKKLAAEQGYVSTLLGRRRDFSRLAGLKGQQREQAEREAINMPIQGTAADIMKQAMITLHQELQTRQLKTKILLQVHDELVLEAPDDEVDSAAQLTRQVMSSAYQLQVPLKVDVEIGPNWLEMQ
jgi:DNA polymerase-1